MARLREQHGSVMDFVQNERLGWTDLEARGKAFEEDGEFVEGFSFLFLFFFFFCFLFSFPLQFFWFVATCLSIFIFSYFHHTIPVSLTRSWELVVDDIKIIYNDWPYGIDKSIVHLCVWTKFPLDVDENDPNGDLTPEMRAKIDEYVNKTFGSRVPDENVSLPPPFFF